MKSFRIQTLAEFTRLIEETCLDQSVTLFRGQACDWPLLPAIARGELTDDDRLLIEQLMLEEFQKQSVPYLRATPTSIWDWIALAQHHGLPTRLLDWSLSPIASLWFAVNQPGHEGQDGVLWILRPTEEDFLCDSDTNPLEGERYMVFAPNHITERITVQKAWFTIHKSRSRNSQFEPLEESPEFKSKLTKVIIPVDRFAHLRFHLNRVGMNHASIFPGLDGLCAHIKWTTCKLKDEEFLE